MSLSDTQPLLRVGSPVDTAVVFFACFGGEENDQGCVYVYLFTHDASRCAFPAGSRGYVGLGRSGFSGGWPSLEGWTHIVTIPCDFSRVLNEKKNTFNFQHGNELWDKTLMLREVH